MNPKGTRREEITNDVSLSNSKEILLGIALTAVAAVICVAIDLLLMKGEN